MKLKVIDFDISSYNSGLGVITKNGRNVNILRTDGMGDYPIQGTIRFDNFSDIFSWTDEGICSNHIEDYNLKCLCNSVEDGEFIIRLNMNSSTGVIVDRLLIKCKAAVLKDEYKDYPSYAQWEIGSSKIQFNIGYLGVGCRTDIIEADKKTINDFMTILKKKKEKKKYVAPSIIKENSSLDDKWCLVRNSKSDTWSLARFDKTQVIEKDVMFVSKEGLGFKYCIPYNKASKYLLGTNEDLDFQK